MQVLVYYERVDAAENDQYSQRVEWVEVPPGLGSPVSMDDNESYSYQVVKRLDYYPVQPCGVDLVAMLFLDQVGQAALPEQEWYCNSGEPKTIHLSLEAPGQKELELSINSEADAPVLGQRLIDYTCTGQFRLVDLGNGELTRIGAVTGSATDWVIDRFDAFIPEFKAPYLAIYLAWCVREAKVLQAA